MIILHVFYYLLLYSSNCTQMPKYVTSTSTSFLLTCKSCWESFILSSFKPFESGIFYFWNDKNQRKNKRFIRLHVYPKFPSWTLPTTLLPFTLSTPHPSLIPTPPCYPIHTTPPYPSPFPSHNTFPTLWPPSPYPTHPYPLLTLPQSLPYPSSPHPSPPLPHTLPTSSSQALLLRTPTPFPLHPSPSNTIYGQNFFGHPKRTTAS